MWTSAELKERAKIALTGNYWKSFGVSLILVFLTGGSGGGGGSSFNQTSSSDFGNIEPEFVILIIGIILVAMLFGFAFQAFISSPIEVGGKRFFTTQAEVAGTTDVAEFGLIGHGFKNGKYMNVVKTMFFKNLYIFLWTLLFIIPGIIKSYAYAMVPYLLADNPGMDTKRAIELSKDMTDGEKMDMFILDLSFIGWFILGFLACCVGMFFVYPYYYATHAELYRTLREKALSERLCSYEELGFMAPQDDETMEEEAVQDDETEF